MSETPLIFVNFDAVDEAFANEAIHALASRGVVCMVPRVDGTAREVREDLEDGLRHADAVLLLQSSAPAQWLRSQLLQHRKILARRDAPLRAFSVLRYAPAAGSEIGVSMPGLDLVDVDDETLHPMVDRFVARCRGSA
jgi:hypothetical protein